MCIINNSKSPPSRHDIGTVLSTACGIQHGNCDCHSPDVRRNLHNCCPLIDLRPLNRQRVSGTALLLQILSSPYICYNLLLRLQLLFLLFFLMNRDLFFQSIFVEMNLLFSSMLVGDEPSVSQELIIDTAFRNRETHNILCSLCSSTIKFIVFLLVR